MKWREIKYCFNYTIVSTTQEHEFSRSGTCDTNNYLNIGKSAVIEFIAVLDKQAHFIIISFILILSVCAAFGNRIGHYICQTSDQVHLRENEFTFEQIFAEILY